VGFDELILIAIGGLVVMCSGTIRAINILLYGAEENGETDPTGVARVLVSRAPWIYLFGLPAVVLAPVAHATTATVLLAAMTCAWIGVFWARRDLVRRTRLDERTLAISGMTLTAEAGLRTALRLQIVGLVPLMGLFLASVGW
jgi:hypothetical protein